MNNIDVFLDTQQRINSDEKLKKLTEKTIKKTRIFEEGFKSSKQPFFSEPKISFEENLTLIPAFRFHDEDKKTAVLNFANPVEPGGGVLRGANAQEEYLCRASNLYYCLTDRCSDPFYSIHNEIFKENKANHILLNTDMIIYSQDVIFFREDKDYYPDTECVPKQEYTNQWRNIDVITCAAPYFRERQYALPKGDLREIFCRRIRNILETAIDNDVEALVLGAFGCGAFNNPPDVVAKAFECVFLEKRYLNAFSDVVFAVKRTGRFCENIEAFDIAFQKFPSTGEYVFSAERNKRRFFQ